MSREKEVKKILDEYNAHRHSESTPLPAGQKEVNKTKEEILDELVLLYPGVSTRNIAFMAMDEYASITNQVSEVMEVTDEMIEAIALERYPILFSERNGHNHVPGIQREHFVLNLKWLRDEKKLMSQPRTEREWISVDERLPEPETEALVYSEDYHQIGIALLNLDGDRFLTNDIDGWDISEYGDSVTHWQPLPSPPDSKQGE